jgi:hypothetical protein
MPFPEPVDPSPLPSEQVAEALDGFTPAQLAAFSALVRCFATLPPRIGLALLRCVSASPATPTPADLADLAGVSRSAVARALARARKRAGLTLSAVRSLVNALHGGGSEGGRFSGAPRAGEVAPEDSPPTKS